MKEKKMFWGLLFLAIGVLILIQTVLKIDLPIVRILIGCGVVFVGVKMIFGSFDIQNNGMRFEKVATASRMIFSEGDLNANGASGSLNRDFATVFGNSKLDLSSLSESEIEKGFEISTVFGKTQVKTPKGIPLIVQTNSAFGQVTVRGDKSATIGNGFFQTPDFSKEKPHLKIEANSVFGSIEIE